MSTSELDGIYFLTSSNALHKLAAAEKWMQTKAELAKVDIPEPNHYWETQGLTTAKLEAFKSGWSSPDDWMDGKKAAGVADVNVGHQIQGDVKFEEARKILVKEGSFSCMAEEMSRKVADRAKAFGNSTVVSRTEAGATFVRKFNKDTLYVSVASRMHVTQLNNPMKDKVLVCDYFNWSGLGEKHFGMPWAQDTLSWIAFLICQNQTGGMTAREMVKLPKSMENIKPTTRDLNFYFSLGRLSEVWLKYVDPVVAFGILQIATNFTIPGSNALKGALSTPGSSHRWIPQY